MKKLIIVLFVLFIPAVLFGETIKLQWDYPEDTNFDGFKIYMKTRYINEYDYTTPLITLNKDVREYTYVAPTIEGAATNYVFVIRAYRNEGEEIIESADSNEVGHKVVGIKPITPINLTGEYNNETSIVNLSWEQPQDEYEIYKWIVYYRLDDATEFTELGRVDKDNELELTEDFNVVQEGESKDVHFTVVAFRSDYAIHSDNSDEFTITISKEGPLVPPENLKIDIQFEVK